MNPARCLFEWTFTVAKGLKAQLKEVRNIILYDIIAEHYDARAQQIKLKPNLYPGKKG